MLAASSSVPTHNTPNQYAGESDPFVLYARSLHDYTLRLWTESRRIAEEKARIKAAASASTGRNQADTPQGTGNAHKRPETTTVQA
ncbi:hypothetical protein BV20DRAFT_934352 [Pilatotrama ljubarskyi]|nr:hypothetical protein BV20DRAFT_934352 [Pilatotrama ljubarskyi]